MRRLAYWIGSLAALGALAAAIALYRQAPSRLAADTARDVSTLATTAEQKRLWQDAADRGLTVGLERLPAAQRSVEQRPPAPPAQKATQPPAAQVAFPPLVKNALRVLAGPPLAVGSERFMGEAVVSTDPAMDRLDIALGPQRTLSLLARVDGKPLATNRGQNVTVEYRPRTDLRVPNDVVGVKLDDGSGIVQLTVGATGPVVNATASLFNITASQIGSPPLMNVRVQVGRTERTMASGETARVGDLTVYIVASLARTGAEVGRIEGSPYVINLLAWKSSPGAR